MTNKSTIVSDRILNWFMVGVCGVALLSLTGFTTTSFSKVNDQLIAVRKEITDGDSKNLSQVMDRLDRLDSKWTSIIMKK